MRTASSATRPLQADDRDGCHQRALRKGNRALGCNGPGGAAASVGDETGAADAAIHDTAGGCAGGAGITSTDYYPEPHQTSI